MSPLPPEPAAPEGTVVALPGEELVLVVGPAWRQPAWPVQGRPLLPDILPAGAQSRVKTPALLALGDLPRPPGAPDRPSPEEVAAALARATGPAAMAALAGVAEIGRRTSAHLAARGLPALLPDVPFHLDLTGDYASLPVMIMQRGTGLPLTEAPPAAQLAFVALLSAIRVRVRGQLLPPNGPHLLFAPRLSAHERVDAARAADRIEAARAAHPDPERFVSALLDAPGALP